MKLSLTGLASDLPASSSWASPGLTPVPPGITARASAFRGARIELDDDDIPTRLHRPDWAKRSLRS